MKLTAQLDADFADLDAQIKALETQRKEVKTNRDWLARNDKSIKATAFDMLYEDFAQGDFRHQLDEILRVAQGKVRAESEAKKQASEAAEAGKHVAEASENE